MTARKIVVFAAFFCAAAPALAEAQQIEGPFQFRNRGAAGEAVGMSPAYRQMIIEHEFTGQRPENLIRDRSGSLLQVERGRSNQAFVRLQAEPFLPSVTGSAGFRIFGFSLGGGGVALAGGGGFSDAGGIFLGWSSMLSMRETGARWTGNGGSAMSPASYVIDSWIGQLASLEQ